MDGQIYRLAFLAFSGVPSVKNCLSLHQVESEIKSMFGMQNNPLKYFIVWLVFYTRVFSLFCFLMKGRDGEIRRIEKMTYVLHCKLKLY